MPALMIDESGRYLVIYTEMSRTEAVRVALARCAAWQVERDPVLYDRGPHLAVERVFRFLGPPFCGLGPRHPVELAAGFAGGMLGLKSSP
jgi:hypothetical protein